MSFAEDLLVVLTSYHGGYKLLRKKMAGYTGSDLIDRRKKYQNLKDQTLRTTLYRLKNKGLIENDDHIWRINQKGKEHIKIQLSNRFPKTIHSVDKNGQKKEIIIMFDIPEAERRKRDWLRKSLTALGFSVLQKSVWTGPAPLPKKFLKDLSDFGIISYVKFFRAAEKDIV